MKYNQTSVITDMDVHQKKKKKKYEREREGGKDRTFIEMGSRENLNRRRLGEF